MGKNHWKRFINYERVLFSFWIISFLVSLVNERLLNSIVPNEVAAYIFWLSLGLYLGFILCKHEYHHALKLQHEQLMVNESEKNTSL